MKENKIIEKRRNVVFKKGWTMVELCVTMIALAILVGISIQSLKPKKFLIGPFAYAGVKNLRTANFEILEKCSTQKGTVGAPDIYGCQSGTGLPDTSIAIDSMQTVYNADPSQFTGGLPTEDTVDDVYCFEIANAFTLINNEINCKYDKTTEASGSHVHLPKGDGKGENAGKPNFQASNMVAYYFLERPWKKIVKGAPQENAMDATDDKDFYKQIFIDVNGNDKPNKLGEDQFPIRIYKLGGEIIPGFCGSDNKGIYTEEDGGETYVSYCPTDAASLSSLSQTNWQDTNYPFSYNLYRSYADASDPNKRYTSTELLGVSYKEAACKSGRHNMLPRDPICSDYKNKYPEKFEGTIYNTAPEFGVDVLNHCTEGELSAFCIVRIARPSAPGLFRLPLL